ncbi:MAG: pseudouridine-5'-phosphate glycosidase [Paracoccaceae bacterium]|nr:pseudouridine-5'-phosphate glycosidase [Paracoccaceae bacterium]
MRLPLQPSPEVASALAAGRPVVALESTIITHGMPAPENIETALACEADIRAEAAVPATVAVIDGVLRVGLEADELRGFASRPGLAKLSRADIAVAMATGASGATTVAATMIAARAAGIGVFATGGIGGVHRGAETSFDVSADLTELAHTPVTVVAAGPKAILDIPKTLERLETLGVPVIAVGQDEVPAFWSRSSGLRAPLRIDDPARIATAHAMRSALGLPGGQLVVNPVPAAKEIPAEALMPMIDRAIAEARAEGVAAKAVTPFLLDRIYEMTGGASLRTNIALVRNNARLAARIAQELSGLLGPRG